MFERFTDRARRVVVLAQEEARLLDHNYIGTEHVLLGLIHEGEGVAAKALEELGISLEAVRREVEEIIGQGASAPSGHIPFTPRAKKVLELALREALQLGHNYIGTEHILLGLIREGEGVAAQVLVRLGADLSTRPPRGDPAAVGLRRERHPPGLDEQPDRRHRPPAAPPGGGRSHHPQRRRPGAERPARAGGGRPHRPTIRPSTPGRIYAAVRDVVRQLDHRLAELETQGRLRRPEAGPNGPGRRRRPRAGPDDAAGLDDLVQLARVHVVDEAPDGVGVGDEGAGLDAGDRLADVLVLVGERLQGERRADARVLLDLALHLVVGEGEHPAVGVVDEDDLGGAEQALGDRRASGWRPRWPPRPRCG